MRPNSAKVAGQMLSGRMKASQAPPMIAGVPGDLLRPGNRRYAPRGADQNRSPKSAEGLRQLIQ